MTFFNLTTSWTSETVYKFMDCECLSYFYATAGNDNVMPEYAVMVDGFKITTKEYDKPLSDHKIMMEEWKYSREANISSLGVKLIKINN